MRTSSVLVLLCLIGCGGNPPSPSDTGSAPDPDAPEKVTLYSIDPNDNAKQQEESFRGRPVLGKVEIQTPAQRKELVAALKDGIARRPEHYAKCFEPRHGLRIVDKDKMTEYVICFSCSNYSEHSDDGGKGLQAINSDVRPTFDKPLQDAGVPLAPK